MLCEINIYIVSCEIMLDKFEVYMKVCEWMFGEFIWSGI